jgi:hypothetical protein
MVMKEFEILVIGKQPRIMETIARLINSKSSLNGSIAYSANEAIAQNEVVVFHLVLIGAGLTEAEAQQIRSFFTVPVVQHYGGGSGLLYAEISQALGVNVAN